MDGLHNWFEEVVPGQELEEESVEDKLPVCSEGESQDESNHNRNNSTYPTFGPCLGLLAKKFVPEGYKKPCGGVADEDVNQVD